MWPFARKKGLKGKDDCVWQSAEFLGRGAAQMAAESAAVGAVTVVTHFPASREEAGAALAEAGLGIDGAQGGLDAAGVRTLLQRAGSGRALLLLSEQLRARAAGADMMDIAVETARPRLSVIGWERHPLRARDDAVVRFAEELNAWYACDVGFHAALDRPPLSMFAGEATRQILQRLGMGPMDSIQHPMLTRSVERAQAEFAEKAPTDPGARARSAAEWLEAWNREQGV